MFCENCGSENLENDKFCENCGNSLLKSNNLHISQNKQKFNIIYPILLILLIGEYFIYNANNQLTTNIKTIVSSNNFLRNKLTNTNEQKQLQANNTTNENTSSTFNCSRVSSDSALWDYCENSNCNGFSNNHGLWTLCENNSPNGLSGNYNIWSYLEHANTSSFSGTAYKGAIQNKGSFSSRKRFTIYYLRGFVYYSY